MTSEVGPRAPPALVAAGQPPAEDIDPLSGQFHSFIDMTGISLMLLMAFARAHRGKRLEGKAFEEMTTKDVVEIMVKPTTTGPGVSFIDKVQSSGVGFYPRLEEALVELFDPADFNIGRAAPLDISLSGPSNVFVSHAWTGNFLRLCESVEAAVLDDNERFASVRSVFLWVDVFCVNQHDTNPLNKLPPGSPVANAFWMGAFRTALSSAGTTLVVLEPHDAPACLTRTWCLWELYCTALSKNRLLVAVHPEVTLHEKLDAEHIPPSWNDMDLSTATAFDPAVVQTVRETVLTHTAGFAYIHGTIHDALGGWLVEQSLLKALWTDYRRLFLLLHVRWLLLLPICGLVAGLAVSPWAAGGGRCEFDLPKENGRCLGLSVAAGAIVAIFLAISLIVVIYPVYMTLRARKLVPLLEARVASTLRFASAAAKPHTRGTWTTRYSDPVWRPLNDALLCRPNWGVLSNSLFSAALAAWLLVLIGSGVPRAAYARFATVAGICAACLLGAMFLGNVQHVISSATFEALRPGSPSVDDAPRGWIDEPSAESASDRLWDMKWLAFVMQVWLRRIWEPRLEGKKFYPGVSPSRPVRALPFRRGDGAFVYMTWRNPWSEVFRLNAVLPAALSTGAAASVLQQSPSQAQRKRIVTYRRAVEQQAGGLPSPECGSGGGNGSKAAATGESVHGKAGDHVLESVALPRPLFWLRFGAALMHNTVGLLMGMPEPPLGPPLILVT